jgi:hypothetical protein
VGNAAERWDLNAWVSSNELTPSIIAMRHNGH